MTKWMGFYNNRQWTITKTKYFTKGLCLLITLSTSSVSQILLANSGVTTESNTVAQFEESYLNQNKIPNKYRPYVEVGAVKHINQTSRGAAIYDLFIPIYQKDSQLIFTDLRLFDRTGKSIEGNIHLGYRKLYPDLKNMFGIYGAYDHRRSDSGNAFNQLTLGFEYWHDKWFIGGNIYKPIRETKKSIGKEATNFTSRNISINSEAIELIRTDTTKTKEYYEKVLPGIDGEIGYSFTGNLTSYIGGYYFAVANATTIAGPKMRLTYDYRKSTGRIFGILDGVSIEAGAQHDKPRGNTAYIGIKLKMGLIDSIASVTNSNIFGFERHMMDLIRRDPDIVINNPQPEERIETKKTEEKKYTMEDAIRDAQEAIKGSNENLKKNKDIVLDGLLAAQQALHGQIEIQTKLPDPYEQVDNVFGVALKETQDNKNNQEVDIQEILRASNENLRKNEEYVVEGAILAKKGMEQIKDIERLVKNDPGIQQAINEHYRIMEEYTEEARSKLEVPQRIHNAAIALLSWNNTYDDMKCNQAVAWVYQTAGLIFHEETVMKFPGEINAIHFRKPLSRPIDLKTGDVGVWKRGNPGESGWIHHMLVYDQDAWGKDRNGKPNNAWSTHSSTHNRYFNGTRYEVFSKSFSQDPEWYRYY